MKALEKCYTNMTIKLVFDLQQPNKVCFQSNPQKRALNDHIGNICINFYRPDISQAPCRCQLSSSKM